MNARTLPIRVPLLPWGDDRFLARGDRGTTPQQLARPPRCDRPACSRVHGVELDRPPHPGRNSSLGRRDLGHRRRHRGGDAGSPRHHGAAHRPDVTHTRQDVPVESGEHFTVLPAVSIRDRWSMAVVLAAGLVVRLPAPSPATRRHLSCLRPGATRQTAGRGGGACPGPLRQPSARCARGIFCGADLAAAETVVFEPDHPTLAAQHTINSVIGSGTADFGVYAAAPQTAEAALTDIRAIAARVLYFANTRSLAQVIPANLLAAYLHSDTATRTRTPTPRLLTAPAAPAAAVAVTANVDRPRRPPTHSKAAKPCDGWLPTPAGPARKPPSALSNPAPARCSRQSSWRRWHRP